MSHISTAGQGRGFTLIELLVVISIFSRPMVHNASNQAQAAACQANLRHSGITLNACAGDHAGKMPPDVPGSTEYEDSWYRPLETHANLLAPLRVDQKT